MAFKSPVVSPLNENQERLLAQLGSLKNILTLPTRKSLNLALDKQISSFDYILRIAESTVGKAFIDILLKKFIDTVFDPNNDKLERIILVSFAKSLNKKGNKISNDPNVSNEQWLINNALPALHLIFQEVKVLIVKQIITMIFGPKKEMNYGTLTQPYPVSTTLNNDEILNQVLAAESMFSLSTSDGNEYGDMEYNLVQLKQQLEAGVVQFTISCQDVKIKLPENFNQEIDGMLNNIISTLPGVSGQPTTGLIQNPTIAFDYISNHVANETQRINTQENANASKKSWLQILLSKLFNLLMISITPFLLDLLNKINTENPTLNLTIIGIVSSPLELKNLEKSDPQSFDEKSEFMKSFLNAMYALLLSILLAALIKEIKKLIKNALAKRASIRLQSKLKRLQKAREGLDATQKSIDKAVKAAEALKQFNDIFNYNQIG